MSLKWLEWSQQLQAIAQNGFAYCQNPYDLERYEQVRQIAFDCLNIYTIRTGQLILIESQTDL